MSTSDLPPQDAPSVIMLPPTMLLLHVMAGITLNWFFGASMGHGWGWLGLIMLGGALGLIWWSKKLFTEAGTNVAPNQPTLVIVKTGPYQYSRNPIYLSFLLGFAGLAFLADAPVMLLVLFPLFYLLDQKVIVPEETYLAEKFGDVYLEYKAETRRWL